MSTLYSGQVAQTPQYLQYAVAKNINITIKGQNLAGNTVVFKVWQYAGASLDITDTASVVNSGSNTDIGITLTAAQTTLAYSRGHYSVHDETADKILLHGELIVEQVPYS